MGQEVSSVVSPTCIAAKRAGSSRLVAVVAAIVAGGTLAVAPTPASASVAEGGIIGAGVVTNDWGDEGPLSATQHANSYAVGVWQWVLYAERVKESDGTTFDLADIDCRFGANTTYATKQLQKKWTLSQDGIVGPATFGRADNNLYISSVDSDFIGYRGDDIELTFFREEVDGGYSFESSLNEGSWHYAAYSTAPSGVCRNG